MKFQLRQLDDGRILLKYQEKHMWLNTPNIPMDFYCENLDDCIDDYTDWLKRNVTKLQWLNND